MNEKTYTVTLEFTAPAGHAEYVQDIVKGLMFYNGSEVVFWNGVINVTEPVNIKEL